MTGFIQGDLHAMIDYVFNKLDDADIAASAEAKYDCAVISTDKGDFSFSCDAPKKYIDDCLFVTINKLLG